MSLRIERGLFKYDFIDHHAVLCVPVDADAKEIRKRYLTIARRLHPDSNANANAGEKQVASEFLSKLVNPAYEKLTAQRSHAEYMIVLSQMGKRLVQESTSVEIHTSVGKQLATAPESNIDHLYKSAIAKLAEIQYDVLQQVPQVIAQISELNLVYLMRTAGKSLVAPHQIIQSTINSAPPTPISPANTAAPPPPAVADEPSAAENYLRRAQTLIDKNQLPQAQIELQDALKLEPKNSRTHSLIALVYLKQNRLKMAKIHFDNALKLDPNDQTALSWKPKIDKALSQQSGGAKVTTPPNSVGKQSPKSGGGGLFGGLFGGKKK